MSLIRKLVRLQKEKQLLAKPENKKIRENRQLLMKNVSQWKLLDMLNCLN